MFMLNVRNAKVKGIIKRHCKFSIKAKKGDILQVSYLTYDNVELKLTHNPKIKINLKKTTASKDEMIITVGAIIIRNPEDEYIEF